MFTAEDAVPPPLPTKLKVFRQFLTNDGTAAGSSAMNVDGSVTPQNFWVAAGQEEDVYISRLSFLILDGPNSQLGQFGAITALTNGCALAYQEGEIGEIVIEPGFKTNFELVRLCSGLPSFGSGNASFIAPNVSGTSDGTFPVLDLQTFGMRWGVRLQKVGSDRITLTVNDLLTGIDAFNCIAQGFSVLPGQEPQGG